MTKPTDAESASDTLEAVLQLMGAEDWDGAIHLLQQRPTETRGKFKLAWHLGWAYFKIKKYAEAAEWLELACQLKPKSASGRWALATVLAARDNCDEAEHQYLLSLALRDSYLARSGLGFLYHRLGRLEEAQAVYLEGIRLRPEDGQRLGAFADFLSDVGRQKEAEVYYQKAAAQSDGEKDLGEPDQ